MKRFFKKLFGFSIGPIVGAIIGFITVPITSHLIDPDQFGLANMFNLANTILTLIVLIGLDQAYMREYNEYKDKKKLLFNAMLIPIISTIIISIILILFSDFWANILFSDSTFTIPIILLGLCSPFFIIEKFLLLTIRMDEKALKYSLWNIFSKTLNLICLIILLLLFRRNFESVVYATIISQFLISVMLVIVCRKDIRISKNSIDKELIRGLLKFALPLLPATLIGYGLNSMDTIFLRVMANYTEIGYYSVALRIVTLLTLVQTSFSSFWAPTAFKWKTENKEHKVFELVSKGISLLMSLILIGILIVKDLIPILLSEKYSHVIYILPFLLFHPIFYTLSETTTLGISFSRKTGYNILVSGISLIINLILNSLFVPKYGAVGAAIATGISYLAFFWVRTIISKKLWYKFPIEHFVITSVILTGIALINTINKNIIISEIINLIGIVLILINYKDTLQYIFNEIRKKNRVYKVGLVCFDTQKKQLINMIDSKNIKIIDLNYSGNKIKRLFLILINMVRVDIIYFGYGCNYVNMHLMVAKVYHKKVICHWIGTDTLKAKDNNNICNIQKYITYNLACSELIKNELKDIGINAEEVPILPYKMEKELSKLPQEHGIISYLPQGKEDFYGIEYIKEAANSFPEIPFYIVGNKEDSLNIKNVHFLGKISQEEMNELYNKTTILVRLPKHDGLSLMLLEALIKGKEVLYCYDFPYTKHIQNLEQLIKTLRDIVSKKPYLNEDGHNYIIENYNIENVKKKVYDIIQNIIEKNI